MEGFQKFLSKYNKGDVIYRKNELQTDFYIINKGKVQLKTGQNEMIVITLSKGQFFGEESLNDDQDALYTVEVIEDSNIIKIPYPSLVEMMKKSPDISVKILKKLSEKHLTTVENIFKFNKASTIPMEQIEENDSKKKETIPKKMSPDVKAYLVIQRSNRIVQLNKTQTFLGRRDYTTGFVPDIDLTKEDEEKYISRKHAGLFFIDGKFFVSEEPGAVNGTFLNGNKLNTGVKYELHDEDEITLCHIQMTFKH